MDGVVGLYNGCIWHSLGSYFLDRGIVGVGSLRATQHSTVR